MMRKPFSVASVVAAVGFGVSVASSSIAAPLQPSMFHQIVGADVHLVSFWGWPYPYGYTYGSYDQEHGIARQRRCVRHIRVRTPQGWQTKTVLSCRG